MGTIPAPVREIPGPPAGRSDDGQVEYQWVWLAEPDEADQ